MSDKRSPDELPSWLYASSPEACAMRDEWRDLLAADRVRVAPLARERLDVGHEIVSKTIVTGPAGNPDGRVPRHGVTHAEIDALSRRAGELDEEMRPDPAIRKIEGDLRELLKKVTEEVDVRAATAQATRTAHARMVAALAELRAAFGDRERSHAEWVRAARVGGMTTVGRTSYELRVFEDEEIKRFRSGALTDGLEEVPA